jgi:cell division protein ZapE
VTLTSAALPFIALLKERLYLLELDSGRDYRLARLVGKPVYHHPLGPAAHEALAVAFAKLTDGAPGEGTALLVKRRLLAVRATAGSRGSDLPSCARDRWPPPIT